MDRVLSFLEDLDWTQFFRIPYYACHESKLQSFQYSVLHCFVNCKHNLFLWNQIESDRCNNCQNVDSVEHFFYYCDTVKQLWYFVKNLIYMTFQIKFDYTVLEILLGIPCKRNTVMCVINFVILFGKKYIYNCKINQKYLSIDHFQNSLKSRIKTEIYMLKISAEDKASSNTLNFWEKLLVQCC